MFLNKYSPTYTGNTRDLTGLVSRVRPKVKDVRGIAKKLDKLGLRELPEQPTIVYDKGADPIEVTFLGSDEVFNPGVVRTFGLDNLAREKRNDYNGFLVSEEKLLGILSEILIKPNHFTIDGQNPTTLTVNDEQNVLVIRQDKTDPIRFTVFDLWAHGENGHKFEIQPGGELVLNLLERAHNGEGQGEGYMIKTRRIPSRDFNLVHELPLAVGTQLDLEAGDLIVFPLGISNQKKGKIRGTMIFSPVTARPIIEPPVPRQVLRPALPAHNGVIDDGLPIGRVKLKKAQFEVPKGDYGLARKIIKQRGSGSLWSLVESPARPALLAMLERQENSSTREGLAFLYLVNLEMAKAEKGFEPQEVFMLTNENKFIAVTADGTIYRFGKLEADGSRMVKRSMIVVNGEAVKPLEDEIPVVLETPIFKGKPFIGELQSDQSKLLSQKVVYLAASVEERATLGEETTLVFPGSKPVSEDTITETLTPEQLFSNACQHFGYSEVDALGAYDDFEAIALTNSGSLLRLSHRLNSAAILNVFDSEALWGGMSKQICKALFDSGFLTLEEGLINVDFSPAKRRDVSRRMIDSLGREIVQNTKKLFVETMALTFKVITQRNLLREISFRKKGEAQTLVQVSPVTQGLSVGERAIFLDLATSQIRSIAVRQNSANDFEAFFSLLEQTGVKQTHFDEIALSDQAMVNLPDALAYFVQRENSHVVVTLPSRKGEVSHLNTLREALFREGQAVVDGELPMIMGPMSWGDTMMGRPAGQDTCLAFDGWKEAFPDFGGTITLQRSKALFSLLAGYGLGLKDEGHTLEEEKGLLGISEKAADILEAVIKLFGDAILSYGTQYLKSISVNAHRRKAARISAYDKGVVALYSYVTQFCWHLPAIAVHEIGHSLDVRVYGDKKAGILPDPNISEDERQAFVKALSNLKSTLDLFAVDYVYDRKLRLSYIASGSELIADLHVMYVYNGQAIRDYIASENDPISVAAWRTAYDFVRQYAFGGREFIN
ncbi:MAG: hypothetical protein KJ811_05410 [Candidatus Margulisbacteria bacterium]|nr:hypothetical protein [Candidatus Margulisiibacteriota bacterium]